MSQRKRFFIRSIGNRSGWKVDESRRYFFERILIGTTTLVGDSEKDFSLEALEIEAVGK